MTRELAGLEVDLTSVNINSTYATHIKLRNKPQVSYSAKENNLSPTPACDNTNDD